MAGGGGESPSALSVHAELFADHVLVDPGAQMFFQAVGEREHHLRCRPVFDELAAQPLRIAAFVVAQEVADFVHGQIALKVEKQVQWTQKEGAMTDEPPEEFTKPTPANLTVTLHFDTSPRYSKILAIR